MKINTIMPLDILKNFQKLYFDPNIKILFQIGTFKNYGPILEKLSQITQA